MAVLTVAVLKHTGHTPALVAASAGGDDFPNDGRTFLHIKNAGAQITVTIDSKIKCSQNVEHDVAVIVPATTGEKLIGPFPKNEFDDSNGRVNVAYTGVTTVTVQAVSLAESGR